MCKVIETRCVSYGLRKMGHKLQHLTLTPIRFYKMQLSLLDNDYSLTSITCVQKQCGVSSDEALKLLQTCQGDVVLAISCHFDRTVLQQEKSNKPTSHVQQSLNTLRCIANEKDIALNSILKKQKSNQHPPPNNRTNHNTVQHESTVCIEELPDKDTLPIE